MNSPIVDLAQHLGINVSEVQPHKLTEQICCRVLHNIHHAESAPIRALEWNPGMTYMGIGAGQIETEVTEILRTEMATADDLLSICSRMDDVLKATEKLRTEIDRFMPHNTYGTVHSKTVSSWQPGIGGMCVTLSDTHNHFAHGIKTTTARIRSVLKRIAAQQAAEEVAMHEPEAQQLGMVI